MATHPSILAWRIPWTEKAGRLQSVGSQRVRTEKLTLSLSKIGQSQDVRGKVVFLISRSTSWSSRGWGCVNLFILTAIHMWAGSDYLSVS